MSETTDTIWSSHAMFLWDLLDNIDTLDDACKGNDLAFRKAVRKQQQRRYEISASDGYNVTFKQDLPPTLSAAQTVQEAARVLLGCPQLSQIGSVPVIASTRALRAVGGQIVQGDALSAIRAALRAIAGGGDE